MLPSLFVVLLSGFTATALPLDDNFEIANGGEIAILVRKEVGNPVDFFDKTFDEYKKGFSAKGESWLGLDLIHRVTSQEDYKLKIILTEFDGKKYHAVYDRFRVGPGDGYVLTVEGFNDSLSTLGDSMIRPGHSSHNLNGMRFTTRDRDQDDVSWMNCAEDFTGGWWYNGCGGAHLTGQHTDRRKFVNSHKHIYYLDGGERETYNHGGKRGISGDSWSEVEMLLLPN